MKSLEQILNLASQFEKHAALDSNRLYTYAPVPVSVELSKWVQLALKPSFQKRDEYIADPEELEVGWGPQSQSSLRKFQAAHNIKFPGYLDAATIELLKKNIGTPPPK